MSSSHTTHELLRKSLHILLGGFIADRMPNLWLWSIVLVGVLTLIYTFEGGIAAVIWTDLVQLVIYIGAVG